MPISDYYFNDGSSKTKNALKLSDYAENVISQRLETIQVLAVFKFGTKRYAMHCG